MPPWKPSQGRHHAGWSREGHSGDAVPQQAAAKRRCGPRLKVPHTDLSGPPSLKHRREQRHTALAEHLNCSPGKGAQSSFF